MIALSYEIPCMLFFATNCMVKLLERAHAWILDIKVRCHKLCENS